MFVLGFWFRFWVFFLFFESCAPLAGTDKNHHFPITGKHRHRGKACVIFWRLISNTVFLKSHDAMVLRLHAHK